MALRSVEVRDPRGVLFDRDDGVRTGDTRIGAMQTPDTRLIGVEVGLFLRATCGGMAGDCDYFCAS
jgi:hypothetical protein